MSPKQPIQVLVAAALLALPMAGCERDTDGLSPLPPNTNPVVFLDEFADGVDYQAFLGSKLDAIAIDNVERFEGSAALSVTVPAPGNPDATYAGGAFTTPRARDLSVYNALTLRARASRDITLDVAGLGNDNTGTSLFTAELRDIPLTASWSRIVIPIPLPDRLEAERGLFFFAEGPEEGAGSQIWFDSVQFETVPGVTDPRPTMASRTVSGFVGGDFAVEGTVTTFDVDGEPLTIGHMPAYFTYTSTDESVARVIGGAVRVLGDGSATITAQLGDIDVNGTINVNATAPPAETAPVPTVPEADVISLFSNAYADRTVDTWSADWDQADLTDIQIQGDDVKVYTNLNFAGIEFGSATIDASEMTHLHVDVFIPAGNVFKVKLVDFGEDGVFGGAPDSEYELRFTVSSPPPLRIGEWTSLEIPMSDFVGLVRTDHIAQLILGGDSSTRTAYVDNIYFHK